MRSGEGVSVATVGGAVSMAMASSSAISLKKSLFSCDERRGGEGEREVRCRFECGSNPFVSRPRPHVAMETSFEPQLFYTLVKLEGKETVFIYGVTKTNKVSMVASCCRYFY